MTSTGRPMHCRQDVTHERSHFHLHDHCSIKKHMSHRPTIYTVTHDSAQKLTISPQPLFTHCTCTQSLHQHTITVNSVTSIHDHSASVHEDIYTVFQNKTSTHIIGYKLRNNCLTLIIFDQNSSHNLTWHDSLVVHLT